MTINTPIIDAGPTLLKAAAKMVVLDICDQIPPTTAMKRQPDGTFTFYYRQTVTEGGDAVEGTMALYNPGIGQLLELYVVASVGSDLVWKKVRPRQVWTDRRTGLPWNPYYDSGMERK